MGTKITEGVEAFVKMILEHDRVFFSIRQKDFADSLGIYPSEFVGIAYKSQQEIRDMLDSAIENRNLFVKLHEAYQGKLPSPGLAKAILKEMNAGFDEAHLTKHEALQLLSTVSGGIHYDHMKLLFYKYGEKLVHFLPLTWDSADNRITTLITQSWYPNIQEYADSLGVCPSRAVECAYRSKLELRHVIDIAACQKVDFINSHVGQQPSPGLAKRTLKDNNIDFDKAHLTRDQALQLLSTILGGLHYYQMKTLFYTFLIDPASFIPLTAKSAQKLISNLAKLDLCDFALPLQQGGSEFPNWGLRSFLQAQVSTKTEEGTSVL